MELVDVKLPTKKSKKELREDYGPSMPEQEEWPYGLRLTFEKDQIDKIPFLEGIDVGDRVLIQAEACVTEVSKTEMKGNKDHHRVGIQIEKVGVKSWSNKPPEKMNIKEYRKMREGK